MNGTPNQPYTLFTPFYEEGWGDFSASIMELIEDVIAERGTPLQRVCDAACGVGALLALLDEGTRELYGYDLSPSMAESARQRVTRAVIACSDLRQPFPFDAPFDLITCTYDSLNYLTLEREMVAFFSHARDVIEVHGELIFDVNDPRMYRERAGKRLYRLVGGEQLSFRFAYEGSRGVATTTIDFPSGRESHRQRAWEGEDINRLAAYAGWEVIESYEVLDAQTGDESGKIIYRCQPAVTADRSCYS